MPDGIRNVLTKEIIQDIHGYISAWYKSNRNVTEQDITYWGFYVYIESSGVWSDALNSTFEKHGLSWLSEYYKHLPWYERDLFDDQVGNMLLEYEIVEPGTEFIDKENDERE